MSRPTDGGQPIRFVQQPDQGQPEQPVHKDPMTGLEVPEHVMAFMASVASGIADTDTCCEDRKTSSPS